MQHRSAWLRYLAARFTEKIARSSYGVEVGVVTGMSSGILVAVAPSVEAWVDEMPDRRLGGYGAILVVIGSLFQTLQYVFPLVGRSMK